MRFSATIRSIRGRSGRSTCRVALARSSTPARVAASVQRRRPPARAPAARSSGRARRPPCRSRAPRGRGSRRSARRRSRPRRAPARAAPATSAPGRSAESSSTRIRASGVRSSCETAAVKPVRSSSKLRSSMTSVRHQIVTIPTPGAIEPAVRNYGRCVGKILIVEDDNVIADGMARHLARPASTRSSSAAASSGSRGSGSRTPTSACST